MTLNDYQKNAAKTARYPKAVGLTYCTLGLNAEAGEFANTYKKVFRDDKGELTTKRRNELVDELGDVLWYVAMTAQELGVSLELLGVLNKVKLMKRYKKKKGDKK